MSVCLSACPSVHLSVLPSVCVNGICSKNSDKIIYVEMFWIKQCVLKVFFTSIGWHDMRQETRRQGEGGAGG